MSGPVSAGSRPTGAVLSLDDPPQAVPASRAFTDRRDAGRCVAESLERFRAERPVVVGIPRGGVPVAAEVARALDAPLDVVVVRKVGAPQNPEFAIGAVAEEGVRLLSERTTRAIGLSAEDTLRAMAKAESELAARARELRGDRPPLDLHGRTAIVVDDGLATGRTAHAAIDALRRRGAARVILAVPVAAPSTVRALSRVADEVVCVQAPADLWAVGLWYEDFSSTSTQEVVALLAAGDEAAAHGRGSQNGARRAADVEIPAAGVVLGGRLGVPAGARGVVAFAHGSGSSRLSPRNQAVARALEDAGHATLLFDLLTPAEGAERSNVFDIELLAERLQAAAAWLSEQEGTAVLPLAFFGASTGAAAALTAAAAIGDGAYAVVSRGGRPDLARGLGRVRAPTLLIVGGADTEVLELNRRAQRQLHCPNELAVVPGATHLFEEPGALEQVTRQTLDWLGHWREHRA